MDGLPSLAHSHAQASAAETSCGFATLAMPESERMNGQTGKHTDLQFDRAEVLRVLRNFLNMDRPYSTARLKE